MNEIAKSGNLVTSHYDSLKDLSNADLIGELGRLIGQTVDNLARMAAIVRRISENGGGDAIIERFGERLIGKLLDIAYGKLDPQVYLAFGGRRGVLSRVQTLPETDQKKLASSDKIHVATIRSNGDRVVREIKPQMIGHREALQVIGNKGIRPVEEQFQLLEQKQQGRPAVHVDHERKGIVAGGVFVSVDRMEKFVEEIRMRELTTTTAPADDIDSIRRRARTYLASHGGAATFGMLAATLGCSDRVLYRLAAGDECFAKDGNTMRLTIEGRKLVA